MNCPDCDAQLYGDGTKCRCGWKAFKEPPKDKREAGICIKCHRKGSITFKGQWYCRQHYDEALETIVSPDESLVQKHVAKLRTILANGNGPMKQHLVAEVNRMQSSLEKSL